jgi:hypothetical protein
MGCNYKLLVLYTVGRDRLYTVLLNKRWLVSVDLLLKVDYSFAHAQLHSPTPALQLPSVGTHTHTHRAIILVICRSF